MTAATPLSPALLARFWARVLCTPDVPGQPTSCWEWQGGRATKMRYGIVALGHTPDGKKVVEYAHRLAWILRHGPVPDDLCVLHRCDNPICCRDDHHFLGTRTANHRDMVAKGRHTRGAEVHWARLTESQVVEIRTAFATGEFSVAELAVEYGVGESTVRDVLAGRTWAHVGGVVRELASEGRAAA